MDALKKRLDELRPLSKKQLVALRQSLRGEDIEFVYASNAIEGSRLTLRETQVVIEQGITIAGKPLQDHIDAKNGIAAVGLMRSIVDSAEPLSAATILALHTRVLGADDPRSGRIRPGWPQVSDDFDAMLLSISSDAMPTIPS